MVRESRSKEDRTAPNNKPSKRPEPRIHQLAPHMFAGRPFNGGCWNRKPAWFVGETISNCDSSMDCDDAKDAAGDTLLVSPPIGRPKCIGGEVAVS